MLFLHKGKKKTKPITQRKLHRQTQSTLNSYNSFQGGAYESLGMHEHDEILSEGTCDCEDIG